MCGCGCVCVSFEGQGGPQVSMFICLCHHPPPQHVGELQPQQQNNVSAKKHHSSYVHVHLRGAFSGSVALTHGCALQLGWSPALLCRCRATHGLDTSSRSLIITHADTILLPLSGFLSAAVHSSLSWQRGGGGDGCYTADV